MNGTGKDREIVRDLARRVATLAHSDTNSRIQKRWRDVNALRKPDRAPVWCRPVGCWEELLPEASLACVDPTLRDIERRFRQDLVKASIADDSPLETTYSVRTVFDRDPPNLWGVEIGRHVPDTADGAWGYDPPLKSDEDFEALRMPRFRHNAEATRRKLAWADELLGDILPVEQVAGMPMSATLGNPAADLHGMTEMMMDMAVAPERMHRLMAHIRDAVLDAMRVVQESGHLTPNNRGPMVCSDPVGDSSGPVTFANLWGQANSQEFDQVSPEMWREFCLEYQRPILEQFGLVAYGCCENLTHKIDGVLSLPNLRIFVCSAWTDLDTVLAQVGSDKVIMWRQKASDVVFAPDEATLRCELEGGMRRLRGRSVQIVLRELQTLDGNLDRLHVWTRIAKETAEKFAD